MRVRPWLSMVTALTMPLVAAAGLALFRDRFDSTNLALVLVVVIVGVAVTGTRSAAITVAAVAALAYDLLLTQPYGSFRIAEPDEVVTAVLLLIVGAVVGSLSNRARQQRVRVTEREDHLGLLYHVIEQVSEGAPDESLIALGEREIAGLLEARACRFADGSDLAGARLAGARPDDCDVGARPTVDRMGEVHIGGLRWPATEMGLPSGEVEIALRCGGMVLGSYVVEPTPGVPVPHWRLVMAVMVADLIASALARWPSTV